VYHAILYHDTVSDTVTLIELNSDLDEDVVWDSDDVFPFDPSETVDADNDGIV
jgi:hypothetical protein